MLDNHKTLILEKIKVGIRDVVSSTFIDSLTLDTEIISNHLLLTLTATLMGKSLMTGDIIEVPTSWWQHLRHTINKRWGWHLHVDLKKHDVSQIRVCPHLNFSSSEQKNCFQYLKGETDESVIFIRHS